MTRERPRAPRLQEAMTPERLSPSERCGAQNRVVILPKEALVMKNTLRKVRLSKETLRALDDARLDQVLGGAWPTRWPTCTCTLEEPNGPC
jgi:hypothetical protein